MPDSGDRGTMTVSDGRLVRLRAGASELALAPAIGGAIAWFRTDGPRGTIDWLRPASTAALDAGLADGMACFPLVPFSNRVRDGRFRFGGRTIQMPPNVPGQAHVEHGHGWQSAWTVAAQADAVASLELAHAADAWPSPYVARQDFALDPGGLAVTLSIRNAGQETMPLGLGLHPYFPRTAETMLTTTVDKMWATDREVMPTALVDLPAGCAFSEGVRIDGLDLDNGFTGWSGRAEITWADVGARLTMTATAPLRFLVIYSPPGERFFCAEPVSNCTDAFNLAAAGRGDTGTMLLEPGATLGATVRFDCRID